MGVPLQGHSTVICAKTAEPIKMPYGLWAQVRPRNRVLDGCLQVLRDVAMTNILGFPYLRCTLAPPGEYD